MEHTNNAVHKGNGFIVLSNGILRLLITLCRVCVPYENEPWKEKFILKHPEARCHVEVTRIVERKKVGRVIKFSFPDQVPIQSIVPPIYGEHYL